MMGFTSLILLQVAVFASGQSCPIKTCPLMALQGSNIVQLVLKTVTFTNGYYCAIPACLSSPCLHGGICEETELGFNCTSCLEGYRGERCEYDAFISSVKLLGGRKNEGRVVFTTLSPNTTYMSIHQTDWSRNASRLICQYLGFEDVYATVSGDVFNMSDTPFEIVRVRCLADVKDITECWHDEHDYKMTIGRNESIAVICCEVNLCNTPQGFSVGLESGQLPDAAITVSTAVDTFDQRKARLNSPTAWIPQEVDIYPWIQITFESAFVISAIITQGRADADQWMTAYTISTKLDGQQWSNYAEIHTDSLHYVNLITGNYDRSSLVVHNFRRPMVCRYLRVNPSIHYRRVALRLELTGYGPLSDVIAAMNNGEPSCSSPNRGEGMGVEDGSIPDFQLTSSSYLDSRFTASKGRLNGGVDAFTNAGWIAAASDQNIWVKIDLGKVFNVTGVVTQGRNSSPQWTTSVRVSYSRNDVTWTFALEPECGRKTYAANYDQWTHKTIIFPRPVAARYVRIHPVTWLTQLQTLRYEVLGLP